MIPSPIDNPPATCIEEAIVAGSRVCLDNDKSASNPDLMLPELHCEGFWEFCTTGIENVGWTFWAGDGDGEVPKATAVAVPQAVQNFALELGKFLIQLGLSRTHCAIFSPINN